jgi:hypothetical protein
VGGGMSALRWHLGPGHRVYFTRHGEHIVLLLAGGDESSQAKDIAKAKELAKEHSEREPNPALTPCSKCCKRWACKCRHTPCHSSPDLSHTRCWAAS